MHQNQKCLINQREVHKHTRSFKDALRAALREDPDIVLVGELRDLETIAIAIETAETGHLVFGTLHTTTAASTVDRVIDQFPADRQAQIRVMLSESLRGVIAQTLCRKIGGGRVAALEVLIVNGAISNLIREGKTFQIPSMMQVGTRAGHGVAERRADRAGEEGARHARRSAYSARSTRPASRRCSSGGSPAGSRRRIISTNAASGHENEQLAAQRADVGRPELGQPITPGDRHEHVPWRLEIALAERPQRHDPYWRRRIRSQPVE